jgi:ketosteroid isomerase-like protein
MSRLGKAVDTAKPNFAGGRDGSSRGDDSRQMPISVERVREIFKRLESGDGAAFFDRVADDVDWTVMGTHPLAGQYLSKKAFIAGTFAKVGQVLPNGAQLRTEHLIAKDDQAVVELHSFATAKNGMHFDNRYCWVVYFRNGAIIRVRAYLDSAMVTRLFQENPIPDTESRN